MRNKQTEKPGIDREQFCASVGADPHTAIVSGGMIENFRRGWAVHIFSKSSGSMRAHYFTRSNSDISVAKASCRATIEAPVRWLYGRGNVPYCRHCLKNHNGEGFRNS